MRGLTQTLGCVAQSWVEEIDFEGTRIKSKGEWFAHDLIIGGDGIKSPIRKQMMARRGEVDKVSSSSPDARPHLPHPRC